MIVREYYDIRKDGVKLYRTYSDETLEDSQKAIEDIKASEPTVEDLVGNEEE